MIGDKFDDLEYKTNVCCNYAGLAKHRLHKMSSIGIWYNKNTRYKIHIVHHTVHNMKRRIKHTNSFVVLEVGHGVER